MKNFDESLIPEIDILESPITWTMAMHEKTGAAIEDLEDYAHRRLLWHLVVNDSVMTNIIVPSVYASMRYLLGMENLK